eukprot:CAMPEP_0198349648 /NCGR_PEP_ID=MMETSP1450-20131203/94962_1 /TAXON_ID=753684 ORGANISM="Madagascaria erythrocladiodes, Strain CCMP3234" /NCGR_SAMPLE_ID=MMETSP1450 /ASSEMBLY_ACC=CAM_ASM_001115 /LENGTH=52 /DNA_ID=CAMNT_0044055347 /DNA_START=1 /DNA_END=156 /DNA_ORIENTATION=+
MCRGVAADTQVLLATQRIFFSLLDHAVLSDNVADINNIYREMRLGAQEPDAS